MNGVIGSVTANWLPANSPNSSNGNTGLCRATAARRALSAVSSGCPSGLKRCRNTIQSRCFFSRARKFGFAVGDQPLQLVSTVKAHAGFSGASFLIHANRIEDLKSCRLRHCRAIPSRFSDAGAPLCVRMHRMPVQFETRDQIAILTIDRPHARNAVDRETAQQLADLFRKFDADAQLSVAILTELGRPLLRRRGSESSGGTPERQFDDRGRRRPHRAPRA